MSPNPHPKSKLTLREFSPRDPIFLPHAGTGKDLCPGDIFRHQATYDGRVMTECHLGGWGNVPVRPEGEIGWLAEETPHRGFLTKDTPVTIIDHVDSMFVLYWSL